MSQNSKQIGRIIERARCLLWDATVELRGDELLWDIKLVDEEAARQFIQAPEIPGLGYADCLRETVLEEDRDRIEAEARRCLLNGRSHYSQEFRVRDAAGSLRWLFEDVRVERLDRDVWRLIGVCVDITEQKETRQFNADLNEMVKDRDNDRFDWGSDLYVTPRRQSDEATQTA